MCEKQIFPNDNQPTELNLYVSWHAADTKPLNIINDNSNNNDSIMLAKHKVVPNGNNLD